MKACFFRSIKIFPVLFVYGCLVACNSQPTQQARSGQCPQTRTTEFAPASIAGKVNPLLNNEENREAGEELYQKSAAPVACAECHGEKGGGNGIMAEMFEPAPRNFTCSEVVTDLPDGQFFWIIKNGSIGTSMPAFINLTDKQIWQLTLYLRSFEVKPVPAQKASAVTNQSKPLSKV